ncbi:hypothetical protein JCM15765_12570 [Paradesulfitobacterium aromaticivorans]
MVKSLYSNIYMGILRLFAVRKDPSTKKEGFIIALATSVNNGSDMCIASHTKQLKSMGVTDEELLEMIAVIDASTGMNRVNTGLRIFPQE